MAEHNVTQSSLKLWRSSNAGVMRNVTKSTMQHTLQRGFKQKWTRREWRQTDNVGKFSVLLDLKQIVSALNEWNLMGSLRKY